MYIVLNIFGFIIAYLFNVVNLSPFMTQQLLPAYQGYEGIYCWWTKPIQLKFNCVLQIVCRRHNATNPQQMSTASVMQMYNCGCMSDPCMYTDDGQAIR